MQLVTITEPAAEPVSLNEMKLHSVLEGNAEDSLVLEKIAAARRDAEERTQRRFITTELELTLDSFAGNFDSDESYVDAIPLPYSPLQSIVSVKYTDTNGTEQTLATSVYEVVLGREPGCLRLKYDQEWPETRDHYGSVRVRYKVGYGDSAPSVPQGITAAIKSLAGELLENREATLSGNIVAVLPFGYKALLDPYRVEVLV